MIDLRLLECFVAIADEGSFSRAALRLQLVQSVVSVRLSRLEDVIGFRVLARTSRRVGLTSEGEAFLPHARALLAQEAQVREAARAIGRAGRETLTVGAFNFLSEERQSLIDGFVSAHPETAISILYGTRSENFAWLENGSTDLFLGLAHLGEKFPDLRKTVIGKRYGHIVLNAEDPLSRESAVTLADLRGQTIVLSPGRHDSELLKRIYARIGEAGLRILQAPEADRRSIEHYARIMHAAHLVWLRSPCMCQTEDGRVLVPLADVDFVTERVVLSRQDNARAGLHAFLRLAEDQARQGVEAV